MDAVDVQLRLREGVALVLGVGRGNPDFTMLGLRVPKDRSMLLAMVNRGSPMTVTLKPSGHICDAPSNTLMPEVCCKNKIANPAPSWALSNWVPSTITVVVGTVRKSLQLLRLNTRSVGPAPMVMDRTPSTIAAFRSHTPTPKLGSEASKMTPTINPAVMDVCTTEAQVLITVSRV